MTELINLKKPHLLIYILVIILLIRFILIDNMLGIIMGALGDVIFAFILIYLLNPLVTYLQQKFKINRGRSVAISYLVLVVILVSLVMIIAPAVINSIKSLIVALPRYNTVINNFVRELNLEKYNISPDVLSSILTGLNNIIYNISQSLLSFAESALISVGILINWIVSLAIALLIAWYGLKQYGQMGERINNSIKVIFNEKNAVKIIHILEITDEAFRKFIVGKLVTCAILGALTYISMGLFNLITPNTIPYLPLIALIIGLTNMIPYIGPLLGAVPCFLLAVFNGIIEGIAVLIIIIILQQVDNLIVGPRVLGSYVGISEFWTIVFISIGGALNGPMGMIIAVPIGTVALALWKEFMEAKQKTKLAEQLKSDAII